MVQVSCVYLQGLTIAMFWDFLALKMKAASWTQTWRTVQESRWRHIVVFMNINANSSNLAKIISGLKGISFLHNSRLTCHTGKKNIGAYQ